MNYQIMMDEELDKIKQLSKKPTLLLHACCAPCSSYVLEYLSSYFDITILYYNPNIFPKEEFTKRYNELDKLIQEMKLDKNVKLVEIGYRNEDFEDVIDGAIVGSRFIRLLEESNFSTEAVKDYIKKFKEEM